MKTFLTNRFFKYKNKTMENITANAFFNMKEVPQTLYVHGSIMTYRPDDKLELVEAVPQGINQKILLLELKFTEGTGPMKGTPKAFSYQTQNAKADQYSQVTIQYDKGKTLTVDISFFG